MLETREVIKFNSFISMRLQDTNGNVIMCFILSLRNWRNKCLCLVWAGCATARTAHMDTLVHSVPGQSHLSKISRSFPSKLYFGFYSKLGIFIKSLEINDLRSNQLAEDCDMISLIWDTEAFDYRMYYFEFQSNL